MTKEFEELIPVKDTNQLASVIVQWHTLQLARTEHMLNVPEGTEVEFEDGENLVLEGKVLSAYRLGLQVALHNFRELPIAAQFEKDD